LDSSREIWGSLLAKPVEVAVANEVSKIVREKETRSYGARNWGGRPKEITLARVGGGVLKSIVCHSVFHHM